MKHKIKHETSRFDDWLGSFFFSFSFSLKALKLQTGLAYSACFEQDVVW